MYSTRAVDVNTIERTHKSFDMTEAERGGRDKARSKNDGREWLWWGRDRIRERDPKKFSLTFQDRSVGGCLLVKAEITDFLGGGVGGGGSGGY